MFSVPHLVVLFLVVLVLFGPHKLPELARGLGKLMAEFRKASNDFKMAFEEEMRNIERQNREAEWKKSQEESEAKRQKELAELASASSSASDSSSAEENKPEPKILGEPGTSGESHEATDAAGSDGAPIEPTMEPVVEPVSEAVARASNTHDRSDCVIDISTIPAEESTSHGSSDHHAEENSPAHQRAPETSDQPK